MKLYLTNGMFGSNLMQIGSEFDSPKTAFELIYAWKHNLENQSKYKIESYDRLLFDDENGKIAIDFGDYSTFMLISGIDNSKIDEFKEY